MDEADLRSMGSDVESHLGLPDFGTIEARGRRIRRRRTLLYGVGAAAVVALSVVFLSRLLRGARC